MVKTTQLSSSEQEQSGLSNEEKVSLYNTFTQLVYEMSSNLPPVCNVKLLPIAKIKANDYKTNTMESAERDLLKRSLLIDGITSPIIVNKIDKGKAFTIIDGVHRFELIQSHPVLQPIPGYAPCVVFDTCLPNCMSSSIRHNSARGITDSEAFADLVINLVQLGWSNERINQEIGMLDDEMSKMLQVGDLGEYSRQTGLSAYLE